MTHDELAQSLADHLRAPDRMAWCDMQLGPQGSPRPDVFTINKSFVRPTPMAYECKVSLSDFRADVTAGKWQSYLQFASGVVFACKAGLLTKGDIPEHCGLIVYSGSAWRAQKKATLRSPNIPQDAWLKLLIDGVEREGPRYRVKPYQEHLYLLKLSHRFGEVVAKTVKDRLRVEDEITGAERTAKRIIDDAKQRAEEIRKEGAEHIAPLRTELCSVLGLIDGADRYQIRQEIDRLRRERAEHPAHDHLRRFTAVVESALRSHGFKEPKSEIGECDD